MSTEVWWKRKNTMYADSKNINFATMQSKGKLSDLLAVSWVENR